MTREPRTCQHCGEEFTPREVFRGRFPKYCSPECRDTTRDEVWKAKGRERTAAQVWHCEDCGVELRGHKRRWCETCRAKRSALPRHELVCEHCGITFKSPDRKYRFCSPACANAAQRKRPREVHCRGCGLPFKPTRIDHTGFCSRACNFATRAKIGVEVAFLVGLARAAVAKEADKRCKQCGGRITDPHRQAYCSDECSHEAVLARERDKRNQCPDCGEPHGRWMHYCDECSRRRLKEGRRRAKRLARKTLRGKQRRKLYNRKRKLRLASIPSSPYVSREIAERDGWRCGVCGGRIDPDLRFPNHRSLSIDHILPLSKGGTDEPHNVQAAHFICNSRKSNKAKVQLRLF